MITAFIKTYGCQANVADSSHLLRYLQQLGCQPVADECDADLIIVNSCAIREKAEHKLFSYLGDLAHNKDTKPHLTVGVIGCVASYRKEELMTRMPHINFVFGARDDRDILKAYLAEVVESIATKKKLPRGSRLQAIKSLGNQGRVPGLVPQGTMINIMRGCNNYCSYCIVPFTTGRERSFALDPIVEQIKREVLDGAKEVTLIGQNVNSYKDPKTGAGFETLLQAVAGIEGTFWVRFVSPHPKDMTTELLDVIAAHPDKLCSYIHLPLQSGSNKILQAMKRTYTIEQYLVLIDEIKKRLPDATLSTDIIVGFPGETQADYQATREAIEAIGFTMIFSFIYSPRKYTKAAELPDSCSFAVKQDRLQALQTRQREIGTGVNKRFIGKTVRVLVKEVGKTICKGRTQGNIRVFIEGQGIKLHTFVDVLIAHAQLSDLRGTIVRREINI